MLFKNSTSCKPLKWKKTNTKSGWCSSENCQQGLPIVSPWQGVLLHTTVRLLLFSSLRTEWHFPPSKSQRCRFLVQVNDLAMPGVLLHINKCSPVSYSSDPAGQQGSLGRGTLGQKGQCCRSPSCSGQYFWEAREVRQERGKEHRKGVGAPVQPPPLKKHCKFSKKNRKSSTFLLTNLVLWKTSNLKEEYRESWPRGLTSASPPLLSVSSAY